MARTKTNNSASTDEKNTPVEAAENATNTNSVDTADNDTTIPVDETAEDEKSKKVKTFKDDDKVKIKAQNCAGKTVIGLDAANPIQFDEKGFAETTGKEANRLLKIPGFQLA